MITRNRGMITRNRGIKQVPPLSVYSGFKVLQGQTGHLGHLPNIIHPDWDYAKQGTDTCSHFRPYKHVAQQKKKQTVNSGV